MEFIKRHPHILYDMSIFGLTSAVGQVSYIFNNQLGIRVYLASALSFIHVYLTCPK